MAICPSDPPTFDCNFHEGRIIFALQCDPDNQHTQIWYKYVFRVWVSDSVKKWGKWAVNAKSFNKCSVREENNYLSLCITVGVNYVVHVKYPEWCLAVVLSKDSS